VNNFVQSGKMLLRRLFHSKNESATLWFGSSGNAAGRGYLR
jgi:hypothetical protein